MKLYADLPARRTRQILADVGVLCWVAVWGWLGRVVHDATLELARPGRTLQGAGQDFTSKVDSAREAATGLPFVGDRLAEPFQRIGSVGSSIEGAGTDLVTAVERLANLLGWVTALVPISMVVLVWLGLRIRFARRASATQRFIDDTADLDLFALRALARQPMQRLAAVSDDPAGAWRARDPQVIHALALLELRATGLHPPVLAPGQVS